MTKLLSQIFAFLVAADSLRFDFWHNVQTRAAAFDFKAEQDYSRAFPYLPTRPSVIFRGLRELPIRQYEDTHLIDFGSGKGRVVLIAATFPFRKVTGIEIRPHLHEIALANLKCRKRFHVRAREIELLNSNVLDFDFPDANLVLFLFNPFPVEVMSQVLARLQAFLHQTGRSVLMVMINSEFDDLMQVFSEFQLVSKSKFRSVYRSKSQIGLAGPAIQPPVSGRPSH